MIVGSIAILAFVTSWDPEHVGKCFTDISRSQFPKWLGCAMALHETLTAGLLAAIGALFGAWLAFKAVQDQIGMAKKNEREAARLKAEGEVQKVDRQIGQLKSAKTFINFMVQSFPQDASPRDLGEQLLTFRRVGRLVTSHSLFADAPEDVARAIETIITQLQSMADNLYEEIDGIEAATRAKIVETRGAEIPPRIASLRQVSDIIDKKMPRYETRFEEAAMKLVVANQPPAQ
jgi:hypothetical protein